MAGLKVGFIPIEGGHYYRDALEEVVRAEDLGFDSVWMEEHHSVVDHYWPSPLLVLGGFATRTSRVTLGTDILVAPFYHPVRLAEDTALLDVMSGGRAVLGVAIGYKPDEFALYGADLARRGGRERLLEPRERQVPAPFLHQRPGRERQIVRLTLLVADRAVARERHLDELEPQRRVARVRVQLAQRAQVAPDPAPEVVLAVDGERHRLAHFRLGEVRVLVLPADYERALGILDQSPDEEMPDDRLLPDDDYDDIDE